MAKKTSETKASRKPSILGTLLGFVLATLLAAGSGFALVWIMKPESKSIAATPGKSAHGSPATADAAATNTIVKSLPPILTNLSGDRPGWIKLELSAVLAADTPAPDTLAAELSEDVMAYLRTVTMTQVAGASGIQALREDLDHIAQVRSKGKARGLLIRTLVIE